VNVLHADRFHALEKENRRETTASDFIFDIPRVALDANRLKSLLESASKIGSSTSLAAV
jgi:hypothetical protein